MFRENWLNKLISIFLGLLPFWVPYYFSPQEEALQFTGIGVETMLMFNFGCNSCLHSSEFAPQIFRLGILTSNKLVFPTLRAPRKAALSGPRYHCESFPLSNVIRYAEYHLFRICICSMAANDKAAALWPVRVAEAGDDLPAIKLLAPYICWVVWTDVELCADAVFAAAGMSWAAVAA